MNCIPIKIYIVRNSQTYLRITLKICCCYFSMNCDWLKKIKEWLPHLSFKQKPKYSTYYVRYKCSEADQSSENQNGGVSNSNHGIHNELQSILKRPTIYELTSEERLLIWNNRNRLRSKKNTVVVFLQSVNWLDRYCVNEAIRLLHKWKSINLDECIESLNTKFPTSKVRKHMEAMLQQFPTAQLILYLPQLIRALQYDEHENKLSFGLMNLLIQWSCRSPEFANDFYWHVMIEITTMKKEEQYQSYKIYDTTMKAFLNRLVYAKPPLKANILKSLNMQQKLMNYLKMIMDMSLVKQTTTDKVETFKYLVRYYGLDIFPPVSNPLQPKRQICGISDDIRIYKSKSMPIRITFKTTNACNGIDSYMAILKSDTHLRQDQLISYLICHIDKILLENNLDLRLTPYRILVMGFNYGLLEFVDAQTITDILAEHQTIHNYLHRHNSSDNDVHHIASHIMDNFVRSCAVYSVITYLLGVGDRHYDNMLLTKDGHLLHIDFTYILGKDPKPMAVAIKFTRELLDAMGGVQSKYYSEFRNHCFECLVCLRCNSNRILNVFEQLAQTHLTNFTPKERHSMVYHFADNFKLHLTNDEAIQDFDNALTISIRSVVPVIMESIHKFAQYLKN